MNDRRSIAFSVLALVVGCALACGSPDPDSVDPPAPEFLGHQEVSIADDGTVTPVVQIRKNRRPRKVGLCIPAGIEQDTSTWRLQLDVDGTPLHDAPLVTDRRTERAACFREALPATLSPGAHSICGLLVDQFDGQRTRLPCLSFHVKPHDEPERIELHSRYVRIMRDAAASDADKARSLMALKSADEPADYPVLNARILLTAAYHLRRSGTPQGLAEASRLVRDTPAWMAGPAGRRWLGMLFYERALLAERLGETRTGWEMLEAAREHFALGGHRERFAVWTRQAELLRKGGATSTAIRRLRAQVAQCRGEECNGLSWVSVRNALGWLELRQPDLSRSRAEELEQEFLKLARLAENKNALEQANFVVNAALARALSGKNPAVHLKSAETLLADSEARAGERAEEIRGWMHAARLQFALERSDASGFESALRQLRSDKSPPELRAFGLARAARRARAAGDLETAASHSEQALLWLTVGEGSAGENRLATGLDEVGQVYFEDASLQLDLGRPGSAWARLRTLDRWTRRRATPCPVQRDARQEDHLATLRADLRRLERPSTEGERREARGVRLEVLQRAEEWILELENCRPTGPPSALATDADYRAYYDGSEIVLLRRNGEQISVVRRTPISREDLQARLDWVEAAAQSTETSTAEWRQRLLPLAEALIPRQPRTQAPMSTVTPTRFALHGALQRAPLEALPLPGDEGRWHADVHLVTRHPRIEGAARAPRRSGSHLFVIDPDRTLAPGKVSDDAIRLATGTVLSGEDARRDAVTLALMEAEGFHFDGHGGIEATFPELSHLRLADGRWFPGLQPELWSGLRWANLSACRSGSYPVTVGAGEYGLGGLLARRGASWVVVTLGDVPDRLAAEFNRVFYQGDAGPHLDVPSAFRRAQARLQELAPPAIWSRWILLQGSNLEEISENFPETASAATPSPGSSPSGGAS